MNELSCLIEELRTCAKTLSESADWLDRAFSGESPKEPEKPALKLEDVRAVLAEKSRAGHTAEIRALLQKYGAGKLSEINPADYEALLKDTEALADE